MTLLPDRICGVMWAINSVLDGAEAAEVNEAALKGFGCSLVESFATMSIHSDQPWPEDCGCTVGYVLEELH